MKTKTLGLLIGGSFFLSGVAFADAKDYQVTGPVVEVNDSMIVIEKKQGKDERWELKRDSNTKGGSDVKVGDKVTAHYTMSATELEVKPAAAAKADKGKKADAKTSATPKP